MRKGTDRTKWIRVSCETDDWDEAAATRQRILDLRDYRTKNGSPGAFSKACDAYLLGSRQGRTRIGIEERHHGLVALLYGGLVGGVGVGVGVLHSLLFVLAFPTVFLAGSLFVARETLSYVSRRRRRELFDLLDRLSEYATDRDRRDAE